MIDSVGWTGRGNQFTAGVVDGSESIEPVAL